MKGNKLLIQISLAFGLASNFSFAERVLSQKELLNRCYTQLTGQRLSGQSPYWAQLGQKSAADICNALIDEVALGADGLLTQSNNRIHRLILRQFHDLHRGWFSARWAQNNDLTEVAYSTVDIYDAAEPSMFITQSLFSQTPVHYNQVLRGYKSLRAIRDSSVITEAEARGTSGVLRPSRTFAGEVPLDQSAPPGIFNLDAISVQPTESRVPTDLVAVPMPIIQVGDLIGYQNSPAATFDILWSRVLTPQVNKNNDALIIPQAVHQSYGGGALGSIPFIMLNFGYDYAYTANGAHKIPRRVMLTAFQTFLCLNGPFVRQSDVSQFLADDSNAAAPPFRHGRACLRCHTAMDQAALTLRNLQITVTAPDNGIAVRSPATVSAAKVTLGNSSTFWPIQPQANFEKTSPQGRLYIRSMTGALVDKQVENLDGLGTAMSNMDDYYTCAAARYFKYFTGIQINLFDPYDSSNESLMASLSEKDREYRDYVIAMGRELKSTGSLKHVVKRIIKSGYYQRTGFGR